MKKKLSIVVPVYNEEKNIESAIRNLLGALEKFNFSYEIILVNDGSFDNTSNVIETIINKNKNIQTIKNVKNLGFGASYKIGLENANGESFLMVQADNAWDEENLTKFLNYFEKYELILGFTRNMLKYRGFTRFIISILFTKILNFLTANNLIYYNGLQLHKTKILKDIKIENNNYIFQAEVLLKTLKYYNNYKFVDIKPTGRDYGISKAFKLKNIYDTLLFIKNSYKYRKK